MQAPDFTQGFNRYSYCLNNPFKYTDPSGEVFVLDDLILAAFIGGMINVAIQGFSGNIESAGDFWLSFGIGALGGALGNVGGQAVASAISIGGAAAGAAIGATAGGMSGFTVSSGNAWMNGANFWQGMAAGGIGLGIGAVSGGIVGGLSGGINARMHGGNFWNGIQVLESPTSGSANGDFMFNNDEELLAWVKESGISLEDYNIDNLSAWKGPNLEINKTMYVRTDDGYILQYSLKTGESQRLGGITVIKPVSRFSGHTDIYMSRISDFHEFAVTLNHELIHAYHYSLGMHLQLGNGFANYTEYIAYQYSIQNNTLSPSYLLRWLPSIYYPHFPPNLIPIK